MALVIVTGMSGAGKSIAINALEDMGYYCVDNLPSKFLVSFADLYGMAENKQEKKIATVVDIRGKAMFGDFFQAMEELSRRQYPYRILFLETDTQTLINRYKFTRRRHPLMEDSGLGMGEAIEQEREFLKTTRLKADYIVDTSTLKPMQLRERVMSLLAEEPEREAMVIRVMSFGFREGIPSDADLVLDVRCLPNPYYLPELREHTGKEECIQKYILSFAESRTFLEKVKDLLDFLLPLYRKEGKGELVVAFGCTGGRHRSVCFAQLAGSYLEKQNNRVLITHRELKEL